MDLIALDRQSGHKGSTARSTTQLAEYQILRQESDFCRPGGEESNYGKYLNETEGLRCKKKS